LFKIEKPVHMKLQITIKGLDDKLILDENYIEFIQSMIYCQIEKIDPDFSKELHDKKTYKHFTFSKLLGVNYKNGKYVVKNTSVVFTISTTNKALMNIINKSFKLYDIINIGELKFIIIGRNLITNPLTENTIFSSDDKGIVIVKTQNDEHNYIKPDSDEYEKLFFERLNNRLNKKYSADELSNFKLKIISEPKKNSIVYKGDKIWGWKYDFTINCPDDIMREGYYSGFGNHTTKGMGYTYIKNKTR